MSQWGENRADFDGTLLPGEGWLFGPGNLWYPRGNAFFRLDRDLPMTRDEPWESPPESIRLPDDEVHVWRARLDLLPESLQAFQGVLADEERERAERLVRGRDRRRSVASRGILRVLLGRYLGLEPGELCFTYGRKGKPALDLSRAVSAPGASGGPSSGTRAELLRFNVSHSGDLLLVGLTADRDLGIDVERVRPGRDMGRIVERFFSEREKAEFRSISEPLKPEAFYTCWSRKEAFLKALGEGLSHPLNRFSVSVNPGEPVRFCCDGPGGGGPWPWTFREIRPGEGYVGAVAVRGRPWRLRCWQWR